jgi:hypothetical protein
VRRFIRGKTAIGQRKKGGLNNMDWKLHAEAFYEERIVKYLQPPKSAWKDLLDQFIVFDKRGLQNLRQRGLQSLTRTPEADTFKASPRRQHMSGDDLLLSGRWASNKI